ncbi:MAG: alpha/beta hydrolase [Acidobacteriota bacterium]
MRLILAAIRVYLTGLSVFSSRLAGLEAFRIFCTPRFKREIPHELVPVMDTAQPVRLEVDGKAVAAFRWPAPSEDSSELGRSPGLDRDPGAPSAPKVLLVHGWESRAGRLAQWVEPLRGAGFEVLAFDAPAHGASEGSLTNPMEFAILIADLESRFGPLHGLVAHSMGCIGAAMAVGGGFLRGAEDVKVPKLLFVGGAESSAQAMTDYCRILGLGPKFPDLVQGAATDAVATGHTVEDLAGHRLLGRAETDVLWLHAPDDDEVSIAEAETAAEACENVTLERFPGLGHHRIARDPAVIERGLSFFSGAGAA